MVLEAWSLTVFDIMNFNDLTVIHLCDAVGIGEDAIVMGDDDDAAAWDTGDAAKEIHDEFSVFGIESCGGFITDDQAWFMHEGSGDGDALLLSA